MARAAAAEVIAPPTGAVLTAAQMQAVEAASGIAPTDLMARAGAAVAQAVRRWGMGAPVTFVCGPGNNGGDGYVAAAILRAAGITVHVAALAPPKTELAQAAAHRWPDSVYAPEAVPVTPVIVDCAFGTGLIRALPPATTALLRRLKAAASLTIAADLPSGIDSDDGADRGSTGADITLALGALKPAHCLHPGSGACGRVVLDTLDLAPTAMATLIAAPVLRSPAASDHKYTRGMVVVVAGAMAGAAVLTAAAAARAGAGYVVLAGDGGGVSMPAAIVQTCRPLAAVLADPRVTAVVVGPGLGRDAAARTALDSVLASNVPTVIDGDALHLVTLTELRKRTGATILTPHAGEFAALFGGSDADKLTSTRAAAVASGAVVVHKGSDTVIAGPDGSARLAMPGSPWLATAGTGDVLAGVVVAMLAGGRAPLAAAAAGVWLHGDAARRAGPGLIADDLIAGLRAAMRAL